MNHTVLIIDENVALANTLSQYLTTEGFQVSCLHEGAKAIKKALNQSVDCIIMDILLPDMSGFEVLKTLREHIDTPILILTARKDDTDRLLSLDMGADDYLVKPCNPHELLSRVQAIIRRTPKAMVQKSSIICHHIVLDCAKRKVMVKDKPLELTHTEFNILEMLIKTQGQAFSKEELTEYALGREFTAYDRSIDVHISNLRNKLGNSPRGTPWIKTVRGFGYVFDTLSIEPNS